MFQAVMCRVTCPSAVCVASTCPADNDSVSTLPVQPMSPPTSFSLTMPSPLWITTPRTTCSASACVAAWLTRLSSSSPIKWRCGPLPYTWRAHQGSGVICVFVTMVLVAICIRETCSTRLFLLVVLHHTFHALRYPLRTHVCKSFCNLISVCAAFVGSVGYPQDFNPLFKHPLSGVLYLLKVEASYQLGYLKLFSSGTFFASGALNICVSHAVPAPVRQHGNHE